MTATFATFRCPSSGDVHRAVELQRVLGKFPRAEMGCKTCLPRPVSDECRTDLFSGQGECKRLINLAVEAWRTEHDEELKQDVEERSQEARERWAREMAKAGKEAAKKKKQQKAEAKKMQQQQTEAKKKKQQQAEPS